MPEFATAGESLLGRELQKEQIVGVDHYVPGQYQADVMDADDCVVMLGFVDGGHRAVLIPCKRQRDGSWRPFPVVRWAYQFHCGPPCRLPESFKLSEEMIQVLDDTWRRA